MLGNDAYGIFVLVSVIGNLNMFTNIGLTTSLIKYLSEQGKCEESNLDIFVSFILYLLIVVPIAIITLIFHKEILTGILNIPNNFLYDTTYLYFYIIISNSLLMVGQIATSVLDSQQKIYITNLLQILYNLIYWGLIFTFLLLNFGLKEIGIPILISSSVWFLLVNYFLFKHWGRIFVKLTLHDFLRISKKQINLGLQVYLSGLIGFFNEPFTKILISQFLGIGYVSFFDIALKIRNQLWGLFGKIFHPLTPYISKLSDNEKIKDIINDLEKKLLILSVPIVVAFIFCINSFISLWIGNNVEIISISCSVIVSGYLLFSISVLPTYVYLMVKGKPSKTIIIQSQNVITNAIVFFVFLNLINYYSVILSSFISVFISFLICLVYQKRYLHSVIFDSISDFSKLILLFVTLSLISFILKLFIHNDYYVLIIIPVSVLLLSIIIYRYISYFNINDISKYFGNNNSVSKIATKLLIRKTV
jgi:O-antigen/teichoic acid export membrane protein